MKLYNCQSAKQYFLQLHGYVSLFFPKESKDKQMYNFNINSGKALIVGYQIFYGKGKRNTAIYLT